MENINTPPSIHKLDKDKAYLIQINTGRMPQPKADLFIKEQREIIGNKLDEFNVTIMGVSEVRPISVFERIDCDNDDDNIHV